MAEEPKPFLDSPFPEVSRQRQVETEALNKTLEVWRRAVHLVLEHHCDARAPIDEEVDTVTRQAVLLMLDHYFVSDEVIMLTESPETRLPRRLSDPSVHTFLAGLTDDTDGRREGFEAVGWPLSDEDGEVEIEALEDLEDESDPLLVSDRSVG